MSENPLEPHFANKIEIRMDVTDTGLGIPNDRRGALEKAHPKESIKRASLNP